MKLSNIDEVMTVIELFLASECVGVPDHVDQGLNTDKKDALDAAAVLSTEVEKIIQNLNQNGELLKNKKC